MYPTDTHRITGGGVARARLMTFKECALEFHAANLTRWKNQKHRDEWISTLRRYAFPIIGHLSVDVIDGAPCSPRAGAAGRCKAGHGGALARAPRNGLGLCQGERTAQRRERR